MRIAPYPENSESLFCRTETRSKQSSFLQIAVLFGLILCVCDRYGFIVMDGNGSLFGALCGNSREVITKFTVDLPKKHGRGGQSALRFARLRLEKRHNYVRKVILLPYGSMFFLSCQPILSPRGRIVCSHGQKWYYRSTREIKRRILSLNPQDPAWCECRQFTYSTCFSSFTWKYMVSKIAIAIDPFLIAVSGSDHHKCREPFFQVLHYEQRLLLGLQ